jgi:tetratricopeptide (TPR) repeat protein
VAQVRNRILPVLAVVLFAANGFAQSANPTVDPATGTSTDAIQAREAIAGLQRAVEEAPGDASAHERLSQGYAIANQPQAALDAIERAVALAPDRPELLSARGTLATWVGDYARARDSYQRLLKARPGDAEASLSLARVSAWSGQIDEAVDAYRRHLQASPDRGSIWLELARTETWRGNYGGALEALSSYHARFGESTEYSRELAAVLARSGQPAKAEAVLEPLLQQDRDNYDLHLTRAIALATQGRSREAFNALDDLRRLQPDGRDTRELEGVLRTMLGSTVVPGGSFYSDSDSLQVQRFTPNATIAVAPGTSLAVGYERDGLTARHSSGLEQTSGALDARHDHGWAGVNQRLGAFTFQGRVGYAMAEQEPLTTYGAGVAVKPFDGLTFALHRSSSFLVVSPRTVGLGLRQLDHRVQLDWLPTVGTHVAFDWSQQELSDGNSRWEVAFSPRLGVARTDWLNLDLGVSAYQLGTSKNLDNGYYDPHRYEFYSVVAYPYVKIGRIAGLGLSTSLGVQRDDSSPSFRFGGSVGADATVGINTAWAFKASTSTTFNQRLQSGAYEGFGASVALVRRF